jgi:hypothetical protein
MWVLWTVFVISLVGLLAGDIATFNYGSPNPWGRMYLNGESTGLVVIDYEWIRHLNVAEAMQSAMIPVARDAQAAHHGMPEFIVGGQDS